MFYIGYGNEGGASRRIARLLSAKGMHDIAIVAPMPYWQVPPTEPAMRLLGTHGTIAAAEFIRRTFDPPTLHAIAESQAAAALMYAALERPEIFDGRIALLKPLGLVYLRKREFARRMIRDVGLHEHVLDWRTWPIAMHVTKRTLQDFWAQKGQRLTVGLSWSIEQTLRQLAGHKPDSIRVFAAQNDTVYPPEAIKEALTKHNLSSLLEVISGTHSSPATKAGSRQVKHVIEWCRSGH